MALFKRLIDPAHVVDTCLVLALRDLQGYAVMIGDQVETIFPLSPGESRVELKSRAETYCHGLNKARYADALTKEAASLGLDVRPTSAAKKLRLVYCATEPKQRRDDGRRPTLVLLKGGQREEDLVDDGTRSRG